MGWREPYFNLVESLRAVLGCPDVLEQSDLQQCFLHLHIKRNNFWTIRLPSWEKNPEMLEKRVKWCWVELEGNPWFSGWPGGSGQATHFFIALEQGWENPSQNNKIKPKQHLKIILFLFTGAGCVSALGLFLQSRHRWQGLGWAWGLRGGGS